MRRATLTLALLIAGLSLAATADKIVAIVGRRVITQGDLQQQIFLYTTQYGIEDEAQLTQDLLEQMIEGAVLLEEAKKETVAVAHKEVEQELTQVIDRMKGRFPSEEEFEKKLQTEHLTLDELRNSYRDAIREQLIIRKLLEQKIRPKIKVSPLEVQKFYEQYKDSIHAEPEKVRLAHVLLSIRPSQATIERAEKRVAEVYQKLQEGQTFASLAKSYSDDLSGERGGDLGYFGKGDLAPELEQECFSLQPGEVTIMTSELGYHIILCHDKTRDRVHISQILVKTVPSPQDSVQVRATAQDLHERILAGQSFSELATLYSNDDATRETGGDLGYIPVVDLSPPFDEVARTLQPGETSQVVLSPRGYHLIQLVERVAERRPSFAEIRDELSNYVFQRKFEDEYKAWIEELKEKVYIEVKL